MSIYSITPFTLLDFPNKSACIFWYAGCNMRCLYCYNPEIVLGKGVVTFPEAISFLQSRQGLLDAVVFSGGECLIHKHIVEQIKAVKAMGFSVKIDTNGSRPDVLKQLINEQLIDYVALDFKAVKGQFQKITQSDLFFGFEESFQVLQKSTVPFEIRTTYHSELISNEELSEMMAYLEANHYTGTYYLQFFRNNVETLAPLPASLKIKAEQIKTNAAFNVVFRD
ncbi:anaerobic ribonucleoside-triphosphate reductase activating protein [Flavobacterium silvisoli]|uniref:Anaerobic ribonucleoside-triphosphate reductase activating protein n=1 Tax=Flavobacterium silvisoli TaxID=2529433 RepID=A0A4Q9YTR2_9FLAO|nr:anaerobic ribonucleoside-triphosphate reductase activating protein [Flavobacterium silvisoli]TBX67013.1 anaerobic ribonucleoside-triphosphate reductase activating protein [Flavobacterium silvisoli]